MGILWRTCLSQGFLSTREKVSACLVLNENLIDASDSYSVLPALSLDGIIHVKVVENAFTMETFNEFIAELIEKMNPYDPINHNKNSVIIMDNCRIHKDPEMIAMVERR